MVNIFKGTKFGDKFKTRDGRIALVIGIYEEMIDDYGYVCCSIDDGTIESHYKCDGTLPYENTKEYEIIGVVERNNNEENLETISTEYVRSIYGEDYVDFLEQEGNAFKAGYRKAKEE